MIQNENIIIFSSDDWNSGLKTSKYHLATRLARENRVLFVNSIGLRNPNLASGKDLGRMWEKLKKFFCGAERIHERLYVFTPLVIPYNRFAPIRAVNRWILLASLRSVMGRLNFRCPILFVFSQNMAGLVGKMGEKQSVYYCIDELTGYREVDKAALQALENELLKKVDCVIACSQELTDHKRQLNRNSYYVPHGVDWDLFSRAVLENLSIPDDLKALPKPVIGFYGFLSDDWIDFALLNHIARAHPEWSLVLIGRSKSELSAVLTEKNIHFLGVKPFEQLAHYSAGFDVGIIPFAINELTRHSNPLKLLEYLSAGLPVVSVNIPEVYRYQDLIAIAHDHNDFVRQIERILADETPQKRAYRCARMKTETWENRLELITDILAAHKKK